MVELSRIEFVAWLKTQPAKRPARTNEQCFCPMASYAKEHLGWSEAFASYSRIFNCSGPAEMYSKKQILLTDLTSKVFGATEISGNDRQIALSDFTFGSFCTAGNYGDIVKILEQRE